MRVLIIAAHGSRRPGANRETHDLASRVAALATGTFDRVVAAFLEQGHPTIDDAAAAAAAEGAREIVVFPHFAGQGTHVARDIPEVVARLAARFPACRFAVTPHLGQAPELPALILRTAASAGDGPAPEDPA